MYSSFELPGPSQGALAYSDRDRYSFSSRLLEARRDEEELSVYYGRSTKHDGNHAGRRCDPNGSKIRKFGEKFSTY